MRMVTMSMGIPFRSLVLQDPLTHPWRGRDKRAVNPAPGATETIGRNMPLGAGGFAARRGEDGARVLDAEFLAQAPFDALAALA